MVNIKPLYYQGMSGGKLPKKLAELRRKRQATSSQQPARTKEDPLTEDQKKLVEHREAAQDKAFEPTRSSTKQQAASPEQQAPSDKPRE